MTHKQKILEILDDGQPHSNFEIHQKTGILRYSARILDLKRDGCIIKSYQDEHDPAKHWFQLIKTNINGVPIRPEVTKEAQRIY